jgi:hypothetical protein
MGGLKFKVHFHLFEKVSAPKVVSNLEIETSISLRMRR